MELEFKDLLRIVRRKLLKILFLTVLAVMITFFISLYVLPPVYEANTTIYTISLKSQPDSGYTYNELAANQQLVKDYQEFIKSRLVIESVISQLKIEGLTYKKLSSNIQVKSKNDTRILDIIVRDNNPKNAKEIADKVTETLKDKINTIINLENIYIIDKAQLPTEPVSPRIFYNTFLAFVISLLASIGLVLAADYFDDSIKNSEDVEKYLNLKVLGNIPIFNKDVDIKIVDV